MIKGALAVAVVLGMTGSLATAVPAHANEPTAEFSIVNGQGRASTAFPETVSVGVPVGEANGSGLNAAWCGGTILDDNWILTAAHCIEPWEKRFEIRVVAYTPFGKAADGVTYPVEYRAQHAYMHPEYNESRRGGPRKTAEHDVALIKLDRPISSGKPIDPNTKRELARFPGETPIVPRVNLADTNEALPTSGTGTVVGRGGSWWEDFGQGSGGQYRANRDLLESADVPINGGCPSSKFICAEQKMPLDEATRRIPEHERHDRRKHRNPASCQGDSGGPLFVNLPGGGRKQVGIVSNSPFTPDVMQFWNGDICGRTETFYASITYLRPWIEHVMFNPIPNGGEPSRIRLQIPSAAGRTDGPGSPITAGQQPPRNQGNGGGLAPPAAQQPPAGQPPAGQPPAGQPPAGQPQPLAPNPEPTPTPEPTPEPPKSLAREGDPEVFKALPAPSKGAMQWVLPPVSADQGSELAAGVSRLRDAFKDTAVAPSSAQPRIALLASEVKMADALASGVLQRDASLYLTNPNGVEPFLLKELKAAKVNEVWLLGGEAALSPAIASTLEAEGFAVRRIAGADRTQTAVEIAKAHAQRHPEAGSARFVARAFGDDGDETRSWADSIALGGLAAKTNQPILLTATQQLSDSLKAQLGSGTKTTVVGGNAAVSPQVKDTINAITGTMPERIAGVNRADTAGRIAQSFSKPERAIVIDGQGQHAWQLGFSLAGLSHDLNAPILLTAGETVPPETKKILKDLELQNVICMGELKVCEAVTDATNQ